MKITKDKTLYAIIGKFIDKGIVNYYEQFSELGKWIYVTPKNTFKDYFWIELIDESKYLDKSQLQEKLSRLANEGSFDKRYAVNWYYQQFLKYSIVLNNSTYEHVYIIDGDTYLARQCLVNFLIPKISRRRFNLYTNFNAKIFDVKNKNNNVCNYMPFQPHILQKMLKIHFGTFSDFIDFVVLTNTKSQNVRFSEYQLYADYLFLSESIDFYNLRMFRRFDLVECDIPDEFNYDALCIETQHNVNFFKKIIAKLLFTFGQKWG